MYGWRTKISIRTDPQRSSTIKDTDNLKSQKTLDWELLNWNFQKDG